MCEFDEADYGPVDNDEFDMGYGPNDLDPAPEADDFGYDEEYIPDDMDGDHRTALETLGWGDEWPDYGLFEDF